MADQRAELAGWVLLSLGIYLLVALAERWLLRARSKTAAHVLTWWHQWPMSPLLSGAAQYAFFLGIPFAAVVSGSADTRTLGLTGSDPLASAAMATAITLGGGGLLAAALGRWRQSAPSVWPAPPEPAQSAGWLALWEAAALQSHMALYRGPFILALGTYYGVFAGLALAILERLAVGLLRQRWSTPEGVQGEVILASIAWSTSLLFVSTNSLWACVATHAALRWGLALVWRRLTTSRPARGEADSL